MKYPGYAGKLLLRTGGELGDGWIGIWEFVGEEWEGSCGGM